MSVTASLMMEGKKVNGRCLLLTDYFIFCPNGGNRSKDLVIKTSHINTVTVQAPLLNLHSRLPKSFCREVVAL